MQKIIKTVGDLRELVKSLESWTDDVNVIFEDRFNQYDVSTTRLAYDIHTNTLSIPCEKIGSILEGTHRVLGKD